MLAKFIFVRPVPLTLMSFVSQTDSLIDFIKKYLLNLKQSRAMHVKTCLVFLTFALQKSCA